MKRDQTTIRVPEELRKQADKKAAEMGISFNALVMVALQEIIRKK